MIQKPRNKVSLNCPACGKGVKARDQDELQDRYLRHGRNCNAAKKLIAEGPA